MKREVRKALRTLRKIQNKAINHPNTSMEITVKNFRNRQWILAIVHVAEECEIYNFSDWSIEDFDKYFNDITSRLGITI